MSDYFGEWVSSVVIGGAIMILLLINLNFSNTQLKCLKIQAIQYGYAEHNSQTGNWEWIEPQQ